MCYDKPNCFCEALLRRQGGQLEGSNTQTVRNLGARAHVESTNASRLS